MTVSSMALFNHLMARYMGQKSKEWENVIMVAMKTMYSQTLMEPINRTCVELTYGLIVLGVLGLESHG